MMESCDRLMGMKQKSRLFQQESVKGFQKYHVKDVEMSIMPLLRMHQQQYLELGMVINQY